MSINGIDNIEYKLKRKTITDEVTGCWLWKGGTARGYGQIQFNFKMHKVHRLSAMLYLGFDLSGPNLVLHHTFCPNKNCWNPNHLYIGTHVDNAKDAIINGTHVSLLESQKTHCPHGHPYSPENTRYYPTGRQCITCTKERDRLRVVLGLK